MDNSAEMPDKQPRRRKSLEERMEAARKAEAKAAETLRRKQVKVQKFQAQQRNLERRHDTRRKIIVGALALEHMKFDGQWKQRLGVLIYEYVTRDQDRALFDLPPLPDNDERRVSPPKIY